MGNSGYLNPASGVFVGPYRKNWWRGDKAHLSNEKNLGCLGYMGDYTTQLYGDYINHYEDPGSLLNNQYNGK